MPTTIDSAGITFNDASTITSANTFIAKPASPSNGQVLGYDGSTWIGTSLSASPASAKAWVNFNASSSQIVSINSNFNVTGVTAGSSGRYVVTVPFTVTGRPVSITAGFNTSGGYPLYGSITSRTTNSITLRCDTGVGGGGNYNDVTDVNVIFY